MQRIILRLSLVVAAATASLAISGAATPDAAQAAAETCAPKHLCVFSEKFYKGQAGRYDCAKMNGLDGAIPTDPTTSAKSPYRLSWRPSSIINRCPFEMRGRLADGFTEARYWPNTWHQDLGAEHVDRQIVLLFRWN